MTSEPNAVHRMPMRTVSPQDRTGRPPKLVKHDGMTKSHTEWAAYAGITRAALYGRLEAGWTFAEAVETDPKKLAEIRARHQRIGIEKTKAVAKANKSPEMLELEAFVSKRADRMTAVEMAAEFGCKERRIRYVCDRLGIRPKVAEAPLPPSKQEPSPGVGDDFVPQPRDISELPAMPGSPERLEALAKLVSEGKELFLPEDRDRVDEALRTAGGARIEAFSMERIG